MLLKRVNLRSVIVFFVFHAILAIGMRQFRPLATMHAYLVVLLALFSAMVVRQPEKIVYWSGYIVACEILWRMNRPPFMLWEFGKYATSLVLGVYTLRKGARKPLLPLLYFCLLIPAIITVSYHDFTLFRNEISFNLSGHLALFIGLLFFSKVQLDQQQFHRLLLIMIGPIVGVAAIAAHTTLASDTIVFNVHSNAVTSGGFGPNQVSAALGVGVFLSFFYIIQNRSNFYLRLWMTAVALALAAQSALTFSRGGLYNAVGAMVLASFYLIQDKKIRRNFILSIGVIAIAINFFIIPRLVQYTGGTIAERFKSTNTTGRSDLMQDDLQLFKENFVFGAGVGQAMYHRTTFKEAVAAHTEFTRLLAEHGLFGLLAILIIFWMSFGFFRRAKTPTAKAVALSFVGWSFFYMSNTAMRLTLPSYMFALASFQLISGLPKGFRLPVPPQNNLRTPTVHA